MVSDSEESYSMESFPSLESSARSRSCTWSSNSRSRSRSRTRSRSRSRSRSKSRNSRRTSGSRDHSSDFIDEGLGDEIEEFLEAEAVGNGEGGIIAATGTETSKTSHHFLKTKAVGKTLV